MDSISVVVRFRPLSLLELAQQQELHKDFSEIWQVNSAPLHSVFNSKTKQTFSYDWVFTEHASNQDVFDTVAQPLIDSALAGLNTTIFAYGQTSSGKTFTIKGTETNPGLIPLALTQLFEEAAHHDSRAYSFKVSYIEVYNEMVNDLLDRTKTNLEIRECQQRGIYVSGLTEVAVDSCEAALALFDQGEATRKFAETELNAMSSRSHTIFRIYIESNDRGDDTYLLRSQLNLVDLAGSEGIHKTSAEDVRKREGSNINRSLLSLSTVIQKLSKSGKGFVNYRDSKMTRLLQPALAGNFKTAVICTVTSALKNFQETINTLVFGTKAKKIKLQAKVNEVLNNDSMVKQYREELSRLDLELEQSRIQVTQRETELAHLQAILQQKEQECTHTYALELENQTLKSDIEALQEQFISQKHQIEALVNSTEYAKSLEDLLIEKDQLLAEKARELQQRETMYEEHCQRSVMEGKLLHQLVLDDDPQYQAVLNELQTLRSQLEEAQQKCAELLLAKDELNKLVHEYEARDQALMFAQLEEENQRISKELVEVKQQMSAVKRQEEWAQNNLQVMIQQLTFEKEKNTELEEKMKDLPSLLEHYATLESENKELEDFFRKSLSHAEHLKAKLNQKKAYILELEELYSNQFRDCSLSITLEPGTSCIPILEPKHISPKSDINESSILDDTVQEESQGELEDLREAYESMRIENSKLYETLEECEMSLKTKAELLEAAQAKTSTLETELAALQSQHNEIAAELVQATEAGQELRKDLTETQSALESIKRHYTFKKQRSALVDSHQLKAISDAERFNLNTRIVELEEQLAETENRLTEASNEITLKEMIIKECVEIREERDAKIAELEANAANKRAPSKLYNKKTGYMSDESLRFLNR